MLPHSFRISYLNGIILMHHVLHCEDAENDADRTVEELIAQLDESEGFISKSILESALYCCNLESERGKFWHPLGHNFDRFIKSILIGGGLHYDKYYNTVYEVRDGAKSPKQKEA